MSTSNNKNAQLAVRYFQCWGSRDLASLELLMAEDCMLVDWDGPCLGRNRILDETRKLFASSKILVLDVKKIAVGQDTVMAELEIRIDKIKMYVVDVLDYNNDSKIQRIRAYRI